MTISQSLGRIERNKDTLLSLILKMEESKVPFNFWYLAERLRYGRIVIWMVAVLDKLP